MKIGSLVSFLLRRPLCWYPYPKLYLIDKPLYCDGSFLIPLGFVIFVWLLVLVNLHIYIFYCFLFLLLFFHNLMHTYNTFQLLSSSSCQLPLSSSPAPLCPFLRFITFGFVLWPFSLDGLMFVMIEWWLSIGYWKSH